MKPKTPNSILKHRDKYIDGSWRDYSLQELGNFVHNLAKRSQNRANLYGKEKDLEDAQNYLNMMQAHIDEYKLELLQERESPGEAKETIISDADAAMSRCV